MSNSYISIEGMKRALGYEEETDMCKNCKWFSYIGKCTFNPTFPWSPNSTGICDNYERQEKTEDEEDPAV